MTHTVALRVILIKLSLNAKKITKRSKVPPPHVITVFDSLYAFKKVTGTAPVNKNGALVGVARELLQRARDRGTQLHWVWVKGHCGHMANERADERYSKTVWVHRAGSGGGGARGPTRKKRRRPGGGSSHVSPAMT